MSEVRLQVFSVPYVSSIFSSERIWAAVPEPTWDKAAARLRADDPVWVTSHLYFHGECSVDSSEYTNPRHSPERTVFWIT